VETLTEECRLVKLENASLQKNQFAPGVTPMPALPFPGQKEFLDDGTMGVVQHRGLDLQHRDQDSAAFWRQSVQVQEATLQHCPATCEFD
jgi:hypothetical protein